MNTAANSRPPGWREAIDRALAAAPEPSPELCEHVAGLIAPAVLLTLEQRAEIARTVDIWPPLTPAERDDIATLLNTDNGPRS
jgi:hypothetical protein